MSGTSGMRLKVKTEELLTIAGEVEDQINSMRQKFTQIDGIIGRSSSYWEGDGQIAYVQAYQKRRDDIDQALRDFSSDVTNLRTIAGVYEETEVAATEAANELSEDVIV